MKKIIAIIISFIPLLAFSGTEAFVLKSNSYGNGIRCPYHNKCDNDGSWNLCPSIPCKDLQNFRNSFVHLANKHDLDPNLVIGYAQRLSLGGEESSRYEFLKHLSKEDLTLIREHFNEYERKHGKIDRKTFLEDMEKNTRSLIRKTYTCIIVFCLFCLSIAYHVPLICKNLLSLLFKHLIKKSKKETIESKYNKLAKEAY